MTFSLNPFSITRKSFSFIIILVCCYTVAFAQPNPSSVSCGTLTGQSLSTNGFSGGNATSTAGSCGQCCYQGADLDGDGDADVNFSVENSKWYRYCNPSSTTPVTIDFNVDETNNDCNLQGAVFVTAGTSGSGSTDALDIDCSNQEYAQFGSGVSGNADGFSFTGVTIPAGGCAWLMVDGYGGASCGSYAVQTICPPACTTPTLVTAGADKLICEGTSVALTTTVSGGVTTTPGPTYSWTPSTGLSCSTCQNPTANPSSTSTYSFTTCNGGPGFCCITDVITVSVTPAFVANAGPDVTSCSPSSVTIGGSGASPTGPAGSTYTWVVSGINNAGIAITSGANTANPIVTINAGLANGSTETYSVTVVNGACTRTDLVTVTVGNLAVNAAADQTVCAGSSITLGGVPTAPAGSTYSWVCSGTACPGLSLSSSTAANPIVTAAITATGTANFTVTATLGSCVNTDVVAVTVNTLPATPTATPSASPVCAGQTVTLTAAGGAGAGTYSWWTASTGGTTYGSANTLTVSPTTTTTYYIQSTNATTGCVSLRGSVTVSVNATPVANAGSDQTLCVGQLFTLNGTITNPSACSPAQTWSVITGSGSFSPSANILNPIFTPTSSGTIQIRLIPCTTGGCTPVMDDIIFTVAPSPSITVSSTNTLLCVGLISDLSGIVSGGTPFPPTTVSQTFSSSTGPFSIPENNTTGVTIPISVSGVTNPTVGATTISSVTVNVDHDRIGQIEVWLCPPGTTPLTGCVQLFNNSGGQGDDLVNTVFTDGSPTDIAAGTPPYTGSYNLDGSNTLSSLNGSPTNGTWSLIVIDNVGTQSTTGTAGQWSITFSTPTPPANPYTYSWTPSTGLSTTTDLNTSFFSSGFTAPTSITHTLTVTDANGCTGKSAITTNIIGTPTLTAGTSQTICATTSSLAAGSLTAGQSGTWSLISGTGTISSSSTNTTNLSGLSIGDNYFKWKVTNSCGSDSTNFKVTVTSSVTPTFNAVGPICSGTTFTLSNSSTNGTPIAGSWSPAITNTTTTQYTFTPTAGQCATTAMITVSITPNPTVAVSNATTCAGTPTVITASGATTYSWSTGATTSTISTSTAGVYTVTGTTNSCANTQTVSLTVTANPTVAVSNATICAGTPTVLTASGAATYSWSTGATTATISTSTAGVYTVTGTTSGCTNTKTVSVTVTANPTVAVSNATTCAGTPTVITASGAATYSWSTGATTSTISTSTAGIYTVTGTTSGCTNTQTVNLTVTANPTVAVSNATTCAGTPTVLTASGATTYSWSTGATTATISTSTAGIYTVTGTTSGCTNTKTVSLTVTANPTVAVSNATICAGTPTVITASGAATYSWSTGATTSTISTSTAGVYTVTGTTSGCTNTQTVSLTVTANPTVAVSNATTCAGTPTVLTASGAATYSWSTGATTSTISTSTAGIYTVTGTTSGCTNTQTVSLTITANPTVAVSNATICAGTPTVLTASGAATYSWSTGATTATISTSTAGVYTVTGTTSGCTNTKTVSVTVTANPTVAVSNATTCAGTPTVITASGAATYSWSTGATTSTISTSTAGIYTVTGTTSGCTNTQTVNLTVTANPTVAVSNATTCAGTPTVLTASGATTYSWSTGATTATISTSTAGIYTVTGTTSGCTNTKTVSLTVTANPTVAVSNATICAGTPTVITASGAATYSWSTGATTSTISTSTAGVYTVTGTTSGCTNTQTVSLTVTANPTVAVSNATTCAGTPTVITASGAATYSWSTGATTSTISTSTAGIYTVTGTTSGCTNTQTVSLTINSIPTTIANTTGTLTCANTSVTLSSTLAGVNYTWTAPAGSSLSAPNSQNTSASGAQGTYTLFVQSIAGCTFSTTTSVSQNTTVPTVNISGSQTITCGAPTVTLTGSATPSISTPVWTGGVSSGSSSYTATASSSNIYTLTVTNPINGCSNSATTQVVSSAGIPMVTTSITNSLSCTTLSAQVVATTTTTPVSYNWAGPGITGSASSASATVNSGGEYTVVVTNTTSSCSTTITVSVVQNTTVPVITASNSETLTCTTLNANASITTTASPVSYNWSGVGITAGVTTETITVNQPGTFNYTVTNTSNSCKTTGTLVVTQNTIVPIVSSATSGTLTCTTLIINATATTTTSPVSYNWSGTGITSGSTTGTISVNQPGAFNYTVTNIDNGCRTTGSQVVVQNTITPIVSSAASGTLTCNTLTINANATTTTSPVAYNWSGVGITAGSTTETITVNQPGTFNYTVTNTDNGCKTMGSQTVTQNTIAPIVSSAASGTLTCNTLTVNAIVTTTTNPVSYNWSGTGITAGATTETITVNQPGTFNYTVTNTNNGCTTLGSQAVTQNTTLPSVNVSGTQTITCGAPTVTLTGSATPSISTPVWTGGVSSGSSSYTATATSPNTYTLTVTDPTNGCSNSATTQVVPSAGIPIVTASVTNSLSCTTLSAQVVATTTASPVSYNWNGPGITGGASTASATVNAGGEYTVVVTNTVSSCSTTITVSVSQNTISPIASGTISGTLTCANLTVNAIVTTTTNPVSYNWSGTGITAGATTETITVNQPGTFNYTVTNTNNGCTTLGSQAVTQNTTLPSVNVSGTQTITCGAPTVTLTGSATPSISTPVWTGGVSSGSSSYTATASSPNTYTLTVTDPINGCINSATTQVVSSAGIPLVTTSVTNSLSCTTLSAQVVVTTTASPVSYNWNGPGITAGANTASATVNAGGDYTVVVTNTISLCSATQTVNVVQNTTAPTASSAASGSITCTTPTVNAIVTTTSSPVSYTWSGTGIIAGATTGTITVNQSGTFNYTVTSTNNGCKAVGSQIVTQNAGVPVVTTSTTNSLSCIASTAQVVATTTTNPVTYTWSGPGIVAGANTASATVNTGGQYTVVVTNTLSVCSITMTVLMPQNITTPTTTASSSGTLTCSTTTVALTSTTPGMSYTWTAPAGGNVNSTNTQSTIASGSGGTYSLNISNPLNGCSYTTTTTVIKNTLSPTITVSGTKTITCLAPTATLNATGGGSYSWSGPGITSGGNTANPVVNLAGTYSVTVTSTINGCTSTTITSVIKNTLSPTITIVPNLTLTCLSPTVTINASGGGTYAWSGPGIISGNNTSNPLVDQPGVYSLTVTNSNGCSTFTTTTVSQNTTMSSPMVLSPDVVIEPGEQTNLSVTGGGITYAWSPPTGLSCTTCTNPVASPKETTQYCVTSTEGICSDTKCVNVLVEFNCENTGDYSTPNAFSPNGDGNNDEFCLQGWKGCLSSFYVAIYNRWGNKVFESTEADFCWDGKYLGKLLDPAVFVFYIKAVTTKGDNIDKKGNITLIK
jgi:gliding motility-associated-like protein